MRYSSDASRKVHALIVAQKPQHEIMEAIDEISEEDFDSFLHDLSFRPGDNKYMVQAKLNISIGMVRGLKRQLDDIGASDRSTNGMITSSVMKEI